MLSWDFGTKKGDDRERRVVFEGSWTPTAAPEDITIRPRVNGKKVASTDTTGRRSPKSRTHLVKVGDTASVTVEASHSSEGQSLGCRLYDADSGKEYTPPKMVAGAKSVYCTGVITLGR